MTHDVKVQTTCPEPWTGYRPQRPPKRAEDIKESSHHLADRFTDGVALLIHCTFRYFLGRTTIATTTFARDLARAWPHIPTHTASMIRRELDEEFDRDDMMRKNNGQDYRHLPLGRDCDRAAWDKVRNAYQEQDKNEEAE